MGNHCTDDESGAAGQVGRTLYGRNEGKREGRKEGKEEEK